MKKYIECRVTGYAKKGIAMDELKLTGGNQFYDHKL